MSVLVSKLRAVLFSNLRDDINPKLREAAFELFNAVDSDLDISDYFPSSTTDDLLEKFESVLAGRATIPDITDDDINDDEEEEEEDSADKIIPTTIPLMDIDLDEDDNT